MWKPRSSIFPSAFMLSPVFMSGGSTPGRGPYGDRVERAVDYLLANAQPSGFIVEQTPTTQVTKWSPLPSTTPTR